MSGQHRPPERIHSRGTWRLLLVLAYVGRWLTPPVSRRDRITMIAISAVPTAFVVVLWIIKT